MANGSLVTNLGKKIILNRAYKSSPDYLVPSKYRLGINNGTPNVADTALDYEIPIANGTVIDNGDQVFTGSGGGDNSSDNSTTYKEGAGQSDGKSQNLIANGSSATKTWTLTPLTASFTASQPFAFWLYIKDTTAYNKFKTSGTAVELRIRTSGDAGNKYYSQTWTAAVLATGWNWMTSNTGLVSAMTQGAGGAPSGALNEQVIIITTNNATDTFVSGDVLYDLMRQWATTDLEKSFVTGYPTLDETNFEVQIRGQILSTEANGFNINGFGLYNSDATNKLHSEDTFTAESKSSTDQFTFIVVDRLI